METKELQEVVNIVSSILKDYPIDYKELKEDFIVITTVIWDFYLTKEDNCYVLDGVSVNEHKLDEEKQDLKKQIKREVFGRYCIKN